MKNFWCEIKLNNIEENIRVIRNLVNNKKVIGIVKGDAYGLGKEKISEFLQEKVDMLAVGTLEESTLIEGEQDILILSPLCTLEDFNCDKENIIFTIDNEEILTKLTKDIKRRVHIYVDTGMSRMGIKPERLDKVIEIIRNTLPNICIEGIYTHLHNSKNIKYTLKQVKRFEEVVTKYINEIPLIHCMASSGIINDEIRNACDFTTGVRAGNILYGYIGFNKGIKKVYEYYATPVNSCFVSKGSYVGYGNLYKAKRDMHVGILNCGNVNGVGILREIKNNVAYDILRLIFRSFIERPVIFNNGVPVKILGKPNMNVTLIDMTNITMDTKLRIDISPIISDSSIEKVYIYE